MLALDKGIFGYTVPIIDIMMSTCQLVSTPKGFPLAQAMALSVSVFQENYIRSKVLILQTDSYDCCSVPCTRITSDIALCSSEQWFCEGMSN